MYGVWMHLLVHTGKFCRFMLGLQVQARSAAGCRPSRCCNPLHCLARTHLPSSSAVLFCLWWVCEGQTADMSWLWLWLMRASLGCSSP